MYDTIRSTFMGELQRRQSVGGSFEEFSTLDIFKRTSFILWCENGDSCDFKALFRVLY